MIIQKQVEDGQYDFCQPYPDYEPLWCTDENGKKLNSQSKCEITGRQSFPPVFVPDRNLAIMSGTMADELLEDTNPNSLYVSWLDSLTPLSSEK